VTGADTNADAHVRVPLTEPERRTDTSRGSAAAARHARVLRIAATGRGGASAQQEVLRDLLDAGSACAVDDVIAELHRRVGTADAATFARTAARLRSLSATTIVVGDDGYPPQLADAWPELGAPLWLFAAGRSRSRRRRRAVAIVGTRAPTLDGVRTAHDLAAALGEAGVVVVSGLARGIDQAAHRGALEVGGDTFAVLGTGLGVDYPARSATLRAGIARSGALFTELPPATGPRPWQFLARNRIISGLADATVVVEGRARSGALQTARMAAGQGRDVWAVPGSINAPTSAAPLALLRDGALPLTGIDEFVTAVTAGARPDADPTTGGARPDADPITGTARPGTPTPARLPPDLSPSAQAVLALLSAVPSSVDALAEAGTLPIHVVMAAVGELTDRGVAARTAHGVVRA
jgi:DNA processing protein